MIIEQERQNVESSQSGGTTEFKIVANAHAFRSLSSNYIDKVSAVIREVSCNAVDAHKAAGVTDPIEVHLPTDFESYFSVRDYGRGLSENEMREIFTTYFYSTKTDSNDFIGGLGLGSKSPFCLDRVSSFNVTSIHNSVKSEYCCYIGEDGTPQISLLASCSTEERSGLNVNVSIHKDILYDFRSKAVNIYQYFDFPVEVNIPSVKADIELNKNSAIINGENFTIRKSNLYYNDFVAVMGGVAYKIPPSLLMSVDVNKKESIRYLSGYMNFNIGDLSFDIGRENLLMDNNTESKVKDKFLEVVNSLSRIIGDMINSKPTVYQKMLEVVRISQEQSLKGFIPKEMKELSLGKCKETILCFKKKRARSNTVVKKDYLYEVPVTNGDYNVEYFLKKPKSLNKINTAFRDSSSTVCVILTDEQVVECGIDLDVVKDPDTLPSVRSKSQSIDFDCYEMTNYSRGRNSWKKVTLPNSSENPNFYVVVKNLEITGRVREYQISQLYNNNPFSFEMPDKIYGLTESFIKSNKFNSNDWTSLDYYVSSEMSKVTSKEYYSFYGDEELANFIVGNIIKKKSEFLEFKNSFINYNKSEEKVKFISSLGYQIDNMNNSATETFNKILDEYPMLVTIDIDRAAKDSKKIKSIREYVGIYEDKN